MERPGVIRRMEEREGGRRVRSTAKNRERKKDRGTKKEREGVRENEKGEK